MPKYQIPEVLQGIPSWQLPGRGPLRSAEGAILPASAPTTAPPQVDRSAMPRPIFPTKKDASATEKPAREGKDIKKTWGTSKQKPKTLKVQGEGSDAHMRYERIKYRQYRANVRFVRGHMKLKNPKVLRKSLQKKCFDKEVRRMAQTMTSDGIPFHFTKDALHLLRDEAYNFITAVLSASHNLAQDINGRSVLTLQHITALKNVVRTIRNQVPHFLS